MKPTIWKNCYSEQWAGILIPPAFAHPAKISLALVKRIFSHAIEKGWIKKGDTCGDPFAGVGGVAFGALLNGIKFIGQELEPHFVELSNGVECTDEKLCPTCKMRQQEAVSPNLSLFDEPERPHHFEGNLEFWRRRFDLNGAIIIQGDSRRLLDNLREQVECVVSSPPYESDGLGHRGSPSEIDIKKKLYARIGNSQYGNSDAQLGNLPAGNFDAVISSPPFGGSESHTGGVPEYVKVKGNGFPSGDGYGLTDGQLGSMPEGCFDIAVSSPPFEDNGSKYGIDGDVNFAKKWQELHGKRISGGPFGYFNKTYGKSKNQIGNQTGETFWNAAREIVQQCFLALKPGGHAIWVTKRFVRNGEIVEFSQQWARLCESVGFKVVCWHHAMLTENGATQIDLNGNDDIDTRERKSFFRRLAEKKGSPPIDWEDVICMVKPARTFERLFIDGRNGAAKLKTETVEV